MSKNSNIILDGQNLTIEELKRFIENKEYNIYVSNVTLEKIKSNRKFLEAYISKGDKIIYGITTGFGPMASHILPQNLSQKLQYNLIFSHAVGIGQPLKPSQVLAAMVVRLNTLIKGCSGISQELIKHLEKIINFKITPIVPEHGAVGTSGDLVQLAHIALGVIGCGDVYYLGKRQKTSSVYKKLKINPYNLKIKEGLSLINGTAMMSGISALAYSDAEKIFNISLKISAYALEQIHAYSDSLDPELHNVRGHSGQKLIAKNLIELLKKSKLIQSRSNLHKKFKPKNSVEKIDEKVQEVYSFRCIPQILGPIIETLQKTKKTIETEINSVTDNPIVLHKSNKIIHGGNFHGEYIAAAMDEMKASIIKLSMLSERRLNFFLNNSTNKIFPPFLNSHTPGFTLGLQGLQFVATSTVAQSQSLAFPHRIHSIPTNGDNQDVVSMGTESSLFAQKICDNAKVILTIEIIALCQITDIKNNFKELSPNSQKIYSIIRKILPKIHEDKEIWEKINYLTENLLTLGI